MAQKFNYPFGSAGKPEGKSAVAEKPQSDLSAAEENAGEHPHTASIHEHLGAMHAEMGGKHMHVHHDGGQITTHHVKEDGSMHGPHNHENLEALKGHMDKFLSEEEHEGGGDDWGSEDGHGAY